MSLRKNRLTYALTGLALTATVLAGCTSGADADVDRSATAEPGTTSGTQSAPSSPSPTVDEEAAAVAAAKEAVKDFYELSDAGYQDPQSFDVGRFESVAVGQALHYMQSQINTAATKGRHSTGAFAVEAREVTNVALENKPKSDPPVYPTVDLTICTDVSAVDVFDSTGQSIVPANRPATTTVFVSVSNIDYPDGAWRVRTVEYPGELKPC